MPKMCAEHPAARATASCGQCGHLFCEHCLVFPFGRQRPPMCVDCALAAGGVRGRRAARPALRRTLVRSRRRDQQAELAAAPTPAPAAADAGAGLLTAAPPAAPSATSCADPSAGPAPGADGGWIGDDQFDAHRLPGD